MASRLVCADQWPPGVDVASIGSGGSSLVKVGTDGCGEDVVAAGDPNPHPHRGEDAFFLSPVDERFVGPSTCAAVRPLAKVAGQLVPFLIGDRPVPECVAPSAEVLDPVGSRSPPVRRDRLCGRPVAPSGRWASQRQRAGP